MSIARSALVILAHTARVDGTVTSEEATLLRRYGRALGVPRSTCRAIEAEPDLGAKCPSTFAETHAERLHILRMMVRVAHADGAISEPEERLLERVARALGIGPLEFADTVVAVAHETTARRRLHRRHAWAVGAIFLLAATLWGSHWLLADRTESLSKRTEAVALESRRNLDRLAADLDMPRATHVHSVFQEIEEDLGVAVVMIHARYVLRSRGRRITRRVTGSGFFVTSTGYIVTNKHVVRGWLFSANDRKLLDEGWTVDRQARFVGAWPHGSRVKRTATSLELGTGWTSTRNSLRVVALPPDRMARTLRKLSNGQAYRSRYHVHDASDLAVLKARVLTPVHAIPLAVETDAIRKLDPVMALGFPGSISARETLLAKAAASLGVVRKVERSIFVTAPIVPGNSGGPLLDMRGRAIGVAFATYGASTVGGCIPSSHVLALLPDAEELTQAAEMGRDRSPERHALDDAALAELRDTGGRLRRRLGVLRSSLLARRDQLLKDAAGARSSDRDPAYRTALEEIVARFGRRWAPQAARELSKFR